MKKLTIGLFNDSFYPMTDGVVKVVDNLARCLSKIANVVVFVPEYKDEYDDDIFPYEVVRCNSLKVPFLDYSMPTPLIDFKFQKDLSKYNLDVVHIHSPFNLGHVGLRYAKEHNIPCIATMHSQFKQDFEKEVKSEVIAEHLNKNFVIKIFNECDECWAVNSEVARIYYEEYGYKTLPKIMNNATDMLPVKNKKEANSYINNLYNLKESDKVFLFVGRINTLKNILFIVDSLKCIEDKKVKFNFKMLFVGSGQDEEILKEHIKKLGMQDKVILCGKVMDPVILSYYYARADLFLFPSLYDASSIVQIESSSQKTPAVFIKGAATAATVTDNVNGFLSENSSEDYANKIIEVITNEKLYKKVSNNAFKDLYKTWDDMAMKSYMRYVELRKLKKSRK